MSNTKYAFATGGTPITTWLINQIEACLMAQKEILEFIEKNYKNMINENFIFDKMTYLFPYYNQIYYKSIQ